MSRIYYIYKTKSLFYRGEKNNLDPESQHFDYAMIEIDDITEQYNFFLCTVHYIISC